MIAYSIKTITKYPEGLTLSLPKGNGYGTIILAMAHNEFLKIDLNAHKNNGAVIYDVKGILEKELTDGRL
ncbi:MAG: hypothetical protein LC658_07135 [Bacteroidales bacterium]|nr:hypothetical protein [Bacteroidales bacterium]